MQLLAEKKILTGDQREVGVQSQNFYCPSITIFSVDMTNADISISSISITLSEV